MLLLLCSCRAARRGMNHKGEDKHRDVAESKGATEAIMGQSHGSKLYCQAPNLLAAQPQAMQSNHAQRSKHHTTPAVMLSPLKSGSSPRPKNTHPHPSPLPSLSMPSPGTSPALPHTAAPSRGWLPSTPLPTTATTTPGLPCAAPQAVSTSRGPEGRRCSGRSAAAACNSSSGVGELLLLLLSAAAAMRALWGGAAAACCAGMETSR